MGIKEAKAQALMIDFQTKLMPVISDKEEIVENTKMLLKGLSVLNVPITITSQYKKGLGGMEEELACLIPEEPVFDKITFSCMKDENIKTRIYEREPRKQVLVFGVEAHICVLQTVADLLEEGFVPVVILDCIGSRRNRDKEIAIMRMKQEGALFSSAESILYELTERAGNETFREISGLIKERKR